MHKQEHNKQSIWCEITTTNYNIFTKDKCLYDECPVCKQYGISCLLKFHKKDFKYFYAYSIINV